VARFISENSAGNAPAGAIFRVVCIRFLMIGGVGIATVWLGLGQMAAEKIATSAVMPVGLLWLFLLFFSAYFVALGQRLTAIILLLAWTGVSVMGNGYVANQLAISLEGPWLSQDPMKLKPFDKVIVLGGGAGTGSNGRLQGNGSGDRLILAAQLFHNGIANDLICTGQRIESMDSNGTDPADSSADILTKLGIPSERIEKLGGRNTSEEISELSKRLTEDKARIGVLTSAWHLPRVLRLARRHGLEIEGIAADFRSSVSRQPPTPGQLVESMVPSATAIATNTALLKEYIGMLAGR
jgi:uncharacterized SAM-binding protein YcdF (DUF218 family)